MTPELELALRRLCDREYFVAHATMAVRPLTTLPVGENAGDWLLYTSTFTRPVIEAVMEAGLWRPGEPERRRLDLAAPDADFDPMWRSGR